MQEQVIKKLTDREHVLLRPNMYIGSVNEVEVEDYFINEQDKFEFQKIKFIPGFLKIINEIIDNSVDEYTRTKGTFATKIHIKINETQIEVFDNGRGIPIKNVEGTDIPMPVMAFTHAKSGSNFDDEGRQTVGMNGVGSFCSNVFSKFFQVKTADGINELTLQCRNNLGEQQHKITQSTQKYTRVNFEPDLEKFRLTKIELIYQKLIKQRLMLLSLSFPQIEFCLNGKRIKYNTTSQFCGSFSEHYVLFEKPEYFISVSNSSTDDFRFFSYVNGLHLKQGGNHINLITTDVVNGLREKLAGYKGIMPGDIKNKLQIVIIFKNFQNMKFDSQTKEFLSNNTQEIRDYMKLGPDDITNFVKRIYANKNIIDPIVEIYKIKEELKKRQEASALLKKVVKVKNDKYMPAIGEQKYLVIGEGDSAVGGLSKSLGRRGFGYFALSGKPLNTHEASLNEVLANEQFKTLGQILGIQYDNKSTITYEYVLVATDQDLDGILIRGLLLTFFMKYCKNLVLEGKIKFLNTPLMVGLKKNIPEKWFYDLGTYNEFLKANPNNNIIWEYRKGLGSWEKEHLQYVITKEGFENMIQPFEYVEGCENSINGWMSKKTVDYRKEMMKDTFFNIEKV